MRCIIAMKRIKYISHYGCKDPHRYRFNSPASDTKKDYYFEVLNRCGYAVDHISRSACSKKGSHSWSYVEKKGDNTFRYFASWCISENRYIQFVNKLFVHIQWFIWLYLNLREREQIMIYHSLAYDSTFIKLKKWKQLRLIGDIEELYQDVHPQSKKVSLNEYRFISLCDKLIFPNTILNERLNQDKRPFTVVHGIYKVREYEKTSFNDGKIHLLYSGTFDPAKGGALAAVKCAEYLQHHYHLHITGFGTKEQETLLLEEIDKVTKATRSLVEFHGYLSDQELMDLMHKCSIGLCTQNPYSELNLTSFPSKIINYMANGLTVLTGRNRAIEESAVGDMVYYYDEQTPEEMAKAIASIRIIHQGEGLERLKKLDEKFTKELRTLIEK